MKQLPLLLVGILFTAACGSSDSSRQTGLPSNTGDASTGGGGGSGGTPSGNGGSSGKAGGSSGGTAGTGGSSGAPNTGGNETGGGSAAGGTDSGVAPVDGGSRDASAPTDAGTCDFGTAASFATQAELNLFGDVVYFDGGASLPAGRYRVTYVDGCMKYSSTQDWTIHAYANGQSAAWWLVGATSGDRIVVPPGTSGYSTANGAYATFDECVTANAANAPVEFDFAGGKLGVWLLDSNYGDNVAGTSGRNPKWKLSLLGACVSGDQ